ncbi:hypothetical protein GCM10022291_28850 [Postechiella marina]|uniref:Uncharacterized protein n=1 Tax=Postechiella marina TaxID=943941 RepID=A0ABP8CFI9_9FLAO
MKTRLLLFYMLLFFGIAYSQIPQSDLLSEYYFDNGSLQDTQNNGSLTQVGSAFQVVDDRYADLNTNAINLNSTKLTRSNFSFNNMSLSFWVKTSANDANNRIIMTKSNMANDVFATNEYGFYVSLINGKIKTSIRTRIQVYATSGIEQNEYGTTSNTNIADGQWHHIIVIIKQSLNNNSNSGSSFYTREVYIDGALDIAQTTQNSVRLHLDLVDNTGDFVINQNRTSSLVANNQYADVIDNLRIYDRALSLAEIQSLNAESNCAPTNLMANNVGFNSAEINWNNNPVQTSWDLAYHESSLSFSNATIITNVTSGYLLTGLTTDTEYNVYVRGNCGGSASYWTSPHTFSTMSIPIYVDVNATGNNDGTSWTDAYNNINTALNANQGKDFWIASGTYKPNTSFEDSSIIVTANQKIYGGFNGTETLFTQRDVIANSVVFSGDRSGNDGNAFIDFSISQFSENSHRVVWVSGDHVVLDGVTISGGYADSSTDSSRRSGSALYFSESAKNATINKVIFERNMATDGGTVFLTHNNTQTGNYNYIFSNCVFKNNLARHSTVMYVANPRNINDIMTTTFVNCLIYGNKVSNILSYPTNGASASGVNNLFWFRANIQSSNHQSRFINCTIADNNFNGSDLSNPAGIITASVLNATSDVSIYNSIFHNNFEPNTTSVEKKVVNTWGNQTPPNSVIARNTLDPDNFSNWTDKQNILTSNPLFSNASNGDYTLQGSSPVIDTGGSQYVTNTKDLLGNDRISGTTVDLGAYEYNQTLSAKNYRNEALGVKLYPNPTSSQLNIDLKSQFKNAVIYSVLGNKVLQTSSKSINTSKLTNGVYLIKIEDKNGNISTKRFIKQ